MFEFYDWMQGKLSSFNESTTRQTLELMKKADPVHYTKFVIDSSLEAFRRGGKEAEFWKRYLEEQQR